MQPALIRYHASMVYISSRKPTQNGLCTMRSGPVNIAPCRARQQVAARAKAVTDEASTAPGYTGVVKTSVTEATVRDMCSMHASLLSEYEYWVEDSWVEGTIPSELEGTYFRNGPGLQVSNPFYQRHTFDGDGLVFSLAFKGGKAFFRNKFVRTRGFLEEQAAGKPIYRNAFTRGAAEGGGRFFNPLDMSFKNVANTGVLHWGGRLYALWEAGRPHELNPKTLDTIGESDLGGLLTGPLAAHYKLYRGQDGSYRWITFAMSSSLSGTSVQFYEINEAGRQVAHSQHVLEGVDVAVVHDMVVTENYYGLVLGSVKFDLLKFFTKYFWGLSSIAECLRYEEASAAQVLLFPRPSRPGSSARDPVVASTPRPFFPFHHINAYEDSSGNVVIDTIAWQSVSFDTNQYNVKPDYWIGGQRSEYCRLVVDPKRSSVLQQLPMLDKQTVEFPTMNQAATGRCHGHFYCIGDIVQHDLLWGPAQALLKVSLPSQDKDSLSDFTGSTGSTGSSGMSQQAARGVQVQRWQPGPRCFPGEPMFVPRPGAINEDDGWILLGVHNADTMKGDIHILDARKISDGPVATLHLPHHLPASLHGSFSPEYLGPSPDDTAVARWKVSRRVRPL